MTTLGETIEIAISKKKVFLMLLGALGFVSIGLWMVLSAPTISNSYWSDSVAIAIPGYLCILFFGLCAFFLIKKMLDDKLGLTIDQTGLTDNSSGVSAGQILWSDIEDISVIGIGKQRIIMLQARNPQDYIDKQTSGFKRKMMQINYKMYGTPLSITPNGLKVSFDELLSILTAKLKAARK